MLKLNFTKVYNVFLRQFLFHTMEKMGILENFIEMVHILFKDARVAMSLNGKIIESFDICHGMRQGYPLFPTSSY
jgi:hypothetical protein